MRKIISLGVIIIALGVAAFFLVPRERIIVEDVVDTVVPSPSRQTEISASFGIYTNNTPRTFSDAMYQNLSDDIYLSSMNPSIVVVRRPSATWGDFFETLPDPFRLDYNCLITGTGQELCNEGNFTLKFYLNGERADNVLSTEIKAGDKLLVSYGNEGRALIDKQIKNIPESK